MAEAADGLDDIRAWTLRVGGTCTVPGVLDALPPQVRDKVELAMPVAAAGTDPSITWKSISRYLKHHGVHLAEYTLRRHHAGECRCE